MRVLLLGVTVCAALVLSMNVQGRAQGPAWVIDPGKSYGPYHLGMSVREVGTLLKMQDAEITKLENTASSSASLFLQGTDGVGFKFESSGLTRIEVSARAARTPSGVGIGSTLLDILRVFGGDQRTEFRSYGGNDTVLQMSGQRCLIATVAYDAANTRVVLDVDYRDRGIDFMLTSIAERPQFLAVTNVAIFAPQACLPDD